MLIHFQQSLFFFLDFYHDKISYREMVKFLRIFSITRFESIFVRRLNKLRYIFPVNSFYKHVTKLYRSQL